MERSRRIAWVFCAVGAAVIGTASGNGRAQSAVPPAQTAPAPVQPGRGRGPAAAPLIDREHLRMPAEFRDPHKTVAVFGSERSDGYYIVGQHFGPHQTSRPHYHDKDRWITVVSGTWYTGEGDVFRPETMVALKPGSVMFHPAGLHHYDGSNDDQEVLLLIAGYGPVTTVQTEVDAQGNPVRGGRGAASPEK
jgi:quercetin dioxygenase-like cupin family protein